MKWTLQKWIPFTLSVLFMSSCNIKAPLDEILPEGNISVAPYIQLTNGADTISIQKLLPSVGSFDSITSTSLNVTTIYNKTDKFVLKKKPNQNVIHPIQIWKQGKKSSIIALNRVTDANSKRVTLTLKSYLNNVIFVNSNFNLSKVIVVWQNTILPDAFVTNDEKGVSIFIPKEAKGVNESTLRVFAQNRQKSIGILSINLLKGVPHQTNN